MSRQYRIVSCPEELIVGERMKIVLEVTYDPSSSSSLPYVCKDWVGIYPKDIPSVPGLSHGRWRYIPSSLPQPQHGGGKQQQQRPSIKPRHHETVAVMFSPGKLPNHGGYFDVRVHTGDSFDVVCQRRMHVLQRPLAMWKRVVFFGLLLVATKAAQAMLNAKGSCGWVSPEHKDDSIRDHAIEMTSDLNAWLSMHPTHAALAQAISSALVDASIIFVVFVGTVRRSFSAPFVAMFTLMLFRFIAQLLAHIPCPPGYMWPRGQVYGIDVPTLFIDYTPANDFFFSGHAGTTFLIAQLLFEMDYMLPAALVAFVVFPFVSTLVIAFRVHRGIDVFTGVLAAIAANHLAHHMSPVIDQHILVNWSHNNTNNNNNNYTAAADDDDDDDDYYYDETTKTQ